MDNRNNSCRVIFTHFADTRFTLCNHTIQNKIKQQAVWLLAFLVLS